MVHLHAVGGPLELDVVRALAGVSSAIKVEPEEGFVLAARA
jgi:hypothetical protein